MHPIRDVQHGAPAVLRRGLLVVLCLVMWLVLIAGQTAGGGGSDRW